MTRAISIFFSLFAATVLSAHAQEGGGSSGLPADALYLMPEFTDGTIYFRGQAPAQGKLNICALDNTLRFIDPSGEELVAANTDNVTRVRIDSIFFMHSGGMYYRMYPVNRDLGIALKRDVQILKDVKQGAYGMADRTSSIRESSAVFSDGITYRLDRNKEYPYSVNEVLFLYKGDNVYVLNKRNLRKLIPEKKDEIDTYFKSGGTLPGTLPETLELLGRWK